MTPQLLLKELAKQIRHAEKIQNSLHPPQPERGSKRNKKKPLAADFIDITQPLSMQTLNAVSKINSCLKLEKSLDFTMCQGTKQEITRLKNKKLMISFLYSLYTTLPLRDNTNYFIKLKLSCKYLQYRNSCVETFCQINVL